MERRRRKRMRRRRMRRSPLVGARNVSLALRELIRDATLLDSRY